MSNVKPPYFGAAYYPEDWPDELLGEDIRLMRRAGMNVMRIGEFAWSRMEPQEGQYDFAWLHRVVDRLGKAGIATILGTPTATPPAWLTQRYPESLLVDDGGQRATHGGRRHVCPNSPVYRAHCARIVTRMGQEFGSDPNVIGWQIDNEMYLQGGVGGRGCCCQICVRKFQDAMRARYGTIEALNAAWGNHIWSNTYQSFDQLIAPFKRAWHHPSFLSAWTEFQSDSIVEYSNLQADILHRYTKAAVGTDVMPYHDLSYDRIHRRLDIVQFNHYQGEGSLHQTVFWMDFCRPIKDRPFWNTETATCWNGGMQANAYRQPGFCRANSWLVYALGGEANLYWLWRAHWAGHEMMHGSVVSSCGRPLHMFDEVKDVAAGLKKSAEFLRGTRPSPTGMAMHWSSWAWRLFCVQKIANPFKYDLPMHRLFRPMLEAQLRMDLIDPAAGLDGYRLVVSSFLPCIEESGLRDRLRRWIEGGGTWVAGPFTDIRNPEAAKYTHAPFGILEDWAGVYTRVQIPGDPHDFRLRWADGRQSTGGIWYDGFDLRGARPLAEYSDGPLAGLAAVAERRMGKGRVILLGTLPPPEDLQRLMLSIAAKADVRPVAEASPNLLAVPRSGKAGRGMVLVEIQNKPATIILAGRARDLITGQRVGGTIEVPPYGVMVLRF